MSTRRATVLEAKTRNTEVNASDEIVKETLGPEICCLFPQMLVEQGKKRMNWASSRFHCGNFTRERTRGGERSSAQQK